MSLYSELKVNKKNNNTSSTKTLVRNQKLYNLMMLVLTSVLIISDILYIIKGNITGIHPFTNGFIIFSLVLEVLMFILLLITRFNIENIIFKAVTIGIFSLPLIAYIGMFGLGDGYSIVLFIFRLIMLVLLTVEIIKGKNYRDNRAFIVKGIIGIAIILALLIPSIALISSNDSRKAKYTYDNAENGYVLKEVLPGSSDVVIKDGTVKIDDNSLENVGKKVTLPKSVKEVSPNAFSKSEIDEVHISSSEINIVEALNNSNVSSVYLESPNIKINNLEELTNGKVKFITSKEDIEKYRDTYANNASLFVPKTLENEFYVILNNTTSDVLYFEKGYSFDAPVVSYPGNKEVKLLGWTYTNDKTKSVSFPILINANIELDAKWSKVYTFTFDYNGGKVIDSNDLFKGEPTSLKRILEEGDFKLPILDKENYRFDGWYDSTKYSDNDYLSNYNFIDEIHINLFGTTSLKAHFSKKYMVDYHTNGGFIPDNGEEEIFIEGTPNIPMTPEKHGYNFLGWYGNPELTGEKINFVYNANTSLYAKWELKDPTIDLSNDINKVYDGKSIELEATIDHELADESAFNYTINWYKEGSDEIITNVVKNAENSKYYCIVKVSYMGDTKTVESNRINVSISKADFDMTDIKYDDTYKYEFNGKPQYPTFNNLPTDLNVTYDVVESNVTDVGDNGKVTAVFSTDSPNYNVPNSLETYVFIEKRKLTVSWDNLELEFTGSNLKPNGTLVGVVDGYEVELILENSNTTSINIYTLEVSLSDIIHYELTDKEVTFKIVKANYDLNTVVFETEFTYDGNYHLPISNNLPEGLSLDLDNMIGLKEACEATDVEVKFINSNPNYNTPDSINISIVIYKKVVSATLSTNIFIYNGDVQVPTITLNGALSSEIVLAEVINNSIDAGQYTANIVLNSSNYELDEASKSLVYIINKADYNISNLEFETTEFVYNGEVRYPVPTNLPKGVEVAKYVCQIDPINVGTYDVTLKFNCDDTANYNSIDDKLVSITIVKANYDLSNLEFETIIFSYTKKAHYPIPTNLPSGLKLDTNNIVGLVDVCDSSEVTLKFINSNNNYNNPDNLVVNITIKPREIYAILDESPFVYKPNVIQAPSVSVSNEMAGDIVNVTVVNESINAGTYVAEFEVDNPNYIVGSEYLNQEYSISKASYDLTSLEYETTIFTYDKKTHYPVPKNLPDALELDTANSDRIKDVCSNKEITLRFINNDSDNYNDPTDVNVTITIKAKEIKATLNPTSFVYNEQKQTPEVNLIDVLEGDFVTANVTNNSVDAGLYTALIELSNNNYVLDTESKALTYTIAKANYDLSDLVYDATEFTYNGETRYPIPTNLPSNLLLDTINTKGLINVCADGEVTLKFINNNKVNYNNPNDVVTTITIKPYEISATLGNEALTFNKKVLVPSVELEGILNADIVNATITNNSINAGNYTAEIELDNSNYVLDEASKSLSYEILKADFEYKYDVDDAEFIYDGNTHTPYVSTIKKYTDYQDLITYSFSQEPIKAGNYEIKITFSVNDNYNDQYVNKNVTILKKELELEFDSLTATYTGELFVPKVVGYVGLIDGDEVVITVTNSNTIEVKDYPIELDYSGADYTNYHVTEENYKITIYGQIVELEGFSVVDYNGVYDGKSHTVNVTGLPEGVTAIYDKSFVDVVENAEVNITFTSNDSNVGYSTTAKGYVTITKKQVEVSFNETTLVYNGLKQAPTPIVTGIIEGDNVGVTFDEYSINVGIYNNINFVLNNSNYKLSESALTELSYEIVPCHVTLVWGTTTFVYNKEEFKPTAVVKYNDEVLGVTVNVTTEGNYINVGKYTATASLSDTNYIIDGSATTTFTIVQKGLTLNWSGNEFVYSGKNQSPTATVNPIIGDNCNVTVTVTGEHKAPSKYTATAELDNDNYKINGNNTYEFTIYKADLIDVNTISEITTTAYDGNIKLPTIDSTNKFASDGSLIMYRIDKEYINVGSYNIEVIFYTENGYYNETDKTVQLIINPVELDITLDKIEFGFNNNIQRPVVTSINNLVDGDIVEVNVTNINSTIGTYIVEFELTGEDATNYQITKEYTYSIVKGQIDMSSVEFTNLTQTYDGTNKLPSVNNLPTGVLVDTENSIGFTNVGTSDVTIKFKLESSTAANYNVPNDKVISMTINPREIEIEWSNSTFGYDGNKHLPEYSLINIISNDTVKLVFENDGSINRGSYKATVTGIDNSNYVFSNSAILECEYNITAGSYDMSDVTVITKEYTYDGNAHKEIEVTAGLPTGVTVKEYVYSADPINAGSYDVTIKFNGDETNYNPIEDITINEAVVINPAQITLSWGNTSFTYNKTSQVPSIESVTGIVVGDLYNITIVGSKVNAGTYTATAKIDNQNYVISNDEIEFTISPKTINVTVICDSSDGSAGSTFNYAYDGKVHNSLSATYDDSELYDGDVLSITVNTSSINANVGTHPYTLNFSNSNYRPTKYSGAIVVSKITINDSDTSNLSWYLKDNGLPTAYYKINSYNPTPINNGTTFNIENADFKILYYSLNGNYWSASSYVLLDGEPTEAGTYYVTLETTNSDNATVNHNGIWSYKSFTYTPIQTKEIWSYDGQYNSNLFNASGNSKDQEATFNIDGKSVTLDKALKLETSSGTVTFKISSSKTIIVYCTCVNDDPTIRINGEKYNVTSGEGTTIVLNPEEETTYTISKGNGSVMLYAIVMD